MKTTKAAFLDFITAVLALLFAIDVSGQGMAPVNPKFVEWQKRRATEMSQSTTNTPAATNSQRRASLRRAAAVGDVVEDGGFGLLPTLVDMDYLADINVGAVRAPVGGFPSSYDLRTQSRLTAVRNQNPYGTCWAHATMASLESGILGREGTTVDFSENNLANLHGWDWGFDDGGNATIATAYLVRWGGPVNETDDIYPNPGGSSMMSPARHVQKVVWIPGKSADLDNDAIKAVVMERGALYVSYYHSSSYYKSSTASYYYPGGGSGNHAVAIVGWDDSYSASNFATKPAGNGAYLVRNSWGSGWGSSGYFWVSYYDSVFARSTMYSFCNAEAADNYGKIYQYDPLGAISHFSTPWGANLFTATGADRIAAVGFYALVPKTSYSLSIYTGCQSGRPTSGTLALSQSGTIDEPGFTTVPLSTSVSVTSGSRFSVVLKLTTPGYGYPQAIEYAYTGITSGANAAAGQSFYSSNGSSWTDLTQWNGTANFCIKAYTESKSATVSLLSVSVSGPASVESGKTAKYACISRYTDNSEKTVSANWSVVSGSAYATIAADGTLTASETSIDRAVVIHAFYAEGGVTKTSDWALTVTAGPPPAPTGLSATQGTETRAVRLSWDAVSGAENYTIYRSATSSTANAFYLGVAEAAKYSDTAAVPGKDYWYFVKARNGSGTGSFSTGVSGWRALAAPSDVVSSDGTYEESITVAWSSVEGAAAYKVYRADDFNGEFVAKTGWISATEWADTTAEPGVTYWYSVVAAVDSAGNRTSDLSVPDDGFRAVPVVPSSLFINGDTSIASGGSASYAVYVEYSDGHRGDTPVSPTWSVSGGSVSRTGVVTAPVVSANTDITLSASTTVEGVHVEGMKTIPVTATVPAAPAGLRVVSATAAGGVSLAWNAASGASGYKVFRSADGANETSFASSTASFTDTTATPGILYAYAVAAENAAGVGARSASVEARIPLAAPTGVSATKDRTDCVRVAWAAVAGATHYRVSRAASASGAKTDLGSSWTAALSFDDTTAVAGTTYIYFVRAATSAAGANAGGYSAGVEGLRKPTRTLVSLSVSGPDRVPASGEAVYSCAANWSDGTVETVSPSWSATPAAAGAIGSDGKFVAAAVTADTTATITANYSGKAGTKAVMVIAPTPATATVTFVSAAQRWPFSGLVDIDYTLETSPSGTKASVSVSATDADHNRALAATTLSGDGADGPVAAGTHRLTWDLAADHPGFHAKALRIDLSAVPASLSAPTGLTASQGTSTAAVALGWSPAEGATGYEIWRGTSNAPSSATKIGISSTTSFSDTSAVPGTRYYYWVKATASFGTSDVSASANGFRKLSPPPNLSATGSTASIALSWTASTGATSYEVWRSTSNSSNSATKIASPPATSYADTSATSGTRYYYWVKAVCANSTSAFSTGVTGVRTLSAPTNLAATGSTASIALSWTASTGATSYEVWRSTSNATGSASKIASPTATSYADTSATPGTRYYYWVKAVCANSTSALSSGANGVRVLSAPTNLSATGSTASIALSWTASTGATSYEVWRSTSNATGSASKIASPTATSYADTSATPGTRYYYWIKAVCANSTSAFSSGANGVRVLSAPTDLSATGSTASIALSWTASTGATSYEVWRSTSNATGSATKIASPTTTSYADTGATPGTRYYYWVKAVCANSTSALSSGANGVRTIAAPTVLAASQGNGTLSARVSISWNAATGATSYEIYRTMEENGTPTLVATVTTTSWTDTAVVYRNPYWYRVKAVAASQTSGFSAMVRGYWGDWCLADAGYTDLMPLRSLLTGLEAARPDGVLLDTELNKAMTNPTICCLDDDYTTISDAEMSIFLRIQTLNQDKDLISSVIRGDYTYPAMTMANMTELQSISDAIRALTKY